ncbi:MAG: hypothetical protein JXR05_12425 [Flavobacteriaceae bacterium]
MKAIIKAISIICVIILFVATLNLPIIYYMPLRTIVFIGAFLYMIYYYKRLFVFMTFCLIAVLFNPIYPIYLYIKSYWIPIDIITGILFLLIAFYDVSKEKKEDNKVINKKSKSYNRDKIY